MDLSINCMEDHFIKQKCRSFMTTPCILLKDGSECPEGILDAFITSAAVYMTLK